MKDKIIVGASSIDCKNLVVNDQFKIKEEQPKQEVTYFPDFRPKAEDVKHQWKKDGSDLIDEPTECVNVKDKYIPLKEEIKSTTLESYLSEHVKDVKYFGILNKWVENNVEDLQHFYIECRLIDRFKDYETYVHAMYAMSS